MCKYDPKIRPNFDECYTMFIKIKKEIDDNLRLKYKEEKEKIQK